MIQHAAVSHDILDFSARVLNTTASMRVLTSSKDAAVRENRGMSTTTRKQRTYDHRLRRLVQTTRDTQLAARQGVPASTAGDPRGWITCTFSRMGLPAWPRGHRGCAALCPTRFMSRGGLHSTSAPASVGRVGLSRRPGFLPRGKRSRRNTLVRHQTFPGRLGNWCRSPGC